MTVNVLFTKVKKKKNDGVDNKRAKATECLQLQ